MSLLRLLWEQDEAVFDSMCSSWETHGRPRNLWELIKGKEIAFYRVREVVLRGAF